MVAHVEHTLCDGMQYIASSLSITRGAHRREENPRDEYPIQEAKDTLHSAGNKASCPSATNRDESVCVYKRFFSKTPIVCISLRISVCWTTICWSCMLLSNRERADSPIRKIPY